jgi:hypothetical protein
MCQELREMAPIDEQMQYKSRNLGFYKLDQDLNSYKTMQ